ncbi:hypothetical protein ACQ4LE_007544 [Meloidogyne hapla]|uniref:Phosphofurin acidic cluster sorting protein 2 n=1 Tax=Meloidogyne hapla TaxID=6305 RepID=A0A1I8BVS7_MELHA
MNSSKPTLPQNVLTMRFYANWDVDRTSSSIAVQRILSMVFTRLVLTKTLITSESTPFTIAVRLQGNRRILRSNDLCISPTKLETPLDISFTIQYSHYIKRKTNNLQILIQRRKRYKNRQIPGFKTLAMGRLNLDEILQFGGSREIIIWDASCLNKARHSMRELHAGKVYVNSCFTSSAESPEPYSGPSSSRRRQRLVATVSEKEPMVLSEEEPEEFTTGEESESDMDDTPRGRSNDQRRQKKFLKQRNIKQRIVALLRKFKPEDDTALECPNSSRSIVPPTEQELEEIFEELGNISDSGPELEPDKMSIISNPRPKIRPFFGSKSDIMPPIEDYRNDEYPFLSDEITDDSESASSNEDAQQSHNQQKHESEQIDVPRKESHAKPSNFHVRPLPLTHSETLQSVLSSSEPPLNKVVLDSIEDLLKRLDNLSMSNNQIVPEHIWICSSSDVTWLSKVNPKVLEPINLFDCPTEGSVKMMLQAVIGKIQNFCNNNSISPPVSIIGVLGGDHLLANVLRAYVHLLQDKACKEDWLYYLRFALVLPPASAIGRLLSQVSGFGGYSEAIWKLIQNISLAFREENYFNLTDQLIEIRNCLVALHSGQKSQRCTNLQIGEAMLQLCRNKNCGGQFGYKGENRTSDILNGKLQVFVPFLAELLTGSAVGSEQPSNSEISTNLTSLHFISGQTAQADEHLTEFSPECSSIDANIANAINTSAKTSRGIYHPTQHSHSSPSIPSALNALANAAGIELKEKEQNEDENVIEQRQQQQNINTSPQRHVGSVKILHSTPSSTEPSTSTSSPLTRELQIEYWTTPNYPCSPPAFSQQTTQSFHHDFCSPTTSNNATNSGSKFSMKASVRTLSIAREPLNHLLSILFVKERKKDKVLQKLGRRSKQKSFENNSAGFCAQSRVVSGVTRIVCTSGGGGIGKKDAGMNVTIDGVLWKGVRFFQISAQWQTHVKLFPVTFPMDLPLMSILPI